jgi:hypothetical protein
VLSALNRTSTRRADFLAVAMLLFMRAVRFFALFVSLDSPQAIGVCADGSSRRKTVLVEADSSAPFLHCQA